MSDAVIIAIVGGVATAVPLIVTQIVAMILSMRGRVRAEEKAIVVGEKLDTIHEQTNSNLTEQKAQIKSLNDRIEVLIQEKGNAEGQAEAGKKGAQQ